jgi:cytochrome o ubiquinol oxidase operon protein cyoD
LTDVHEHAFDDRTPGVEEHEPTASYLSHTAGLALAILATIAAFVVAQTDFLWPPGIPVGLMVLAFAQIDVHLVFFLHLRSGPDSTNNILALAFGVLIVLLVIAGSVWDHRQPQQQYADVDAVSGETHHERFTKRSGAESLKTTNDGSVSARVQRDRGRRPPQAAPVPVLTEADWPGRATDATIPVPTGRCSRTARQ